MEERNSLEEVPKTKIEVKNLDGESIGNLTVEEANNIVTNLIVSGIHFKEVDILGVKFTFKTISKVKRADILKKVSEMRESDAVVGDHLTMLNLSACLESVGTNKVKDADEAFGIVSEMEEHVFARVYEEYLKFMFEVQSAVHNEDAVKN